jgi:hypothetical protein
MAKLLFAVCSKNAHGNVSDARQREFPVVIHVRRECHKLENLCKVQNGLEPFLHPPIVVLFYSTMDRHNYT